MPKLEVRNLTIQYEGAPGPALRNVSFDARPGAVVVIVGRTGSGKSTLLKALSRLIEIPRGAILLNGLDVIDLSVREVRDQLGYAPQDAFLFSRTLHENIAFGVPGADVKQVEESVRLASLDTDVHAFPEGLETLVGERGITLSGGQRQRATLARALLLDAGILLLDDTLSAVDTETETKILAALTGAETKRTLIIATHRLAFAAKADVILVLEGGEVVEQGTEAELLRRQGTYARMHRRQRLREAVEGASGPGHEEGAHQ